MSQFDKYIKIGQEMISEANEPKKINVINEGINFVRINANKKNNIVLKKFLSIKKPVYIGIDEQSIYVAEKMEDLKYPTFDKKLGKRKVENVIDFFAVLYDNVESVKELPKNDFTSHQIWSETEAKVFKFSLSDSIAIADADGIEEIYFIKFPNQNRKKITNDNFEKANEKLKSIIEKKELYTTYDSSADDWYLVHIPKNANVPLNLELKGPLTNKKLSVTKIGDQYYGLKDPKSKKIWEFNKNDKYSMSLLKALGLN